MLSKYSVPFTFILMAIGNCRPIGIVKDDALANCQAINREIYENPSDEDWCCKCLAGTYKESDCRLHFPKTTKCKICPFDETDPVGQYYMDVQNNSTRCIKSLEPSECGNKMETHYVMGSIYANARCECNEGYYEHGDGCIQHSPCSPGFQPSALGTNTTNTKCEPCPPGSFSNVSSATAPCSAYTICPYNTTEVRDGTSTSDTICSRLLIIFKNNVTTTTITTTTKSVEITVTSSADKTSSGDAGHLGSGIIAGIVIIFAVVAIVILCCVRRKCRRKRENTEDLPMTEPYGNGVLPDKEPLINDDHGNGGKQDTGIPDSQNPDDNQHLTVQIPQKGVEQKKAFLPGEGCTNGNRKPGNKTTKKPDQSLNKPQGDESQRMESSFTNGSGDSNSKAEPIDQSSDQHKPQGDESQRMGSSHTNVSRASNSEAKPTSTQKCNDEGKEMMDIDFIDSTENPKAQPSDQSSESGSTSPKSLHAEHTPLQSSQVNDVDQRSSSDNAASSGQDIPVTTATSPKSTFTSQNDHNRNPAESEAAEQAPALRYAFEEARRCGANDRKIEQGMKDHKIGCKMMDVLNDFLVDEVKPYVRGYIDDKNIDDIEKDVQSVSERRYQWVRRIKQQHGNELTPEFIFQQGFRFKSVRDKMFEVFKREIS